MDSTANKVTVNDADAAERVGTFLLCPVGSAGDVYPFLGLGLRLRSRGHRVVVLTSGYFQAVVERVGLEFVDVLSRERFLELTENPLLWHPWLGASAVLKSFQKEYLRTGYQAVVDQHVAGETVVITSALGFGPRIAHDQLGMPLVTIDLQPFVQWSKYESPLIPGLFKSAPPWFKQTQFQIGQMIFNRIVAPRINPFRAELGLPPVRKCYPWMHSPERILCLYPEWYAPPQPDWPERVRLTQFPLWNEQADQPLPPDVAEFLDAGDAPIVFTPGSANVHGRAFFEASAEACQRMGRRGMLFTRFADSVPKELPEGVAHFEYAPFTALLPRAAAMVHHGGIGTTSAALAAGVPQLIMPLSHDQPDNLARLQRLGVGDGLLPKKYRAAAVADKLQRLLTSADVASKCEEVAKRFVGVDPYADSVKVVEACLPV